MGTGLCVDVPLENPVPRVPKVQGALCANLSGKRTEKKSLGAALFASRAGACFGWSQKIRPGHVFITESGEIPPMEIEQLTELICLLTGAQEIHYTRAGCTIASHCGPKMLGVLFMVE